MPKSRSVAFDTYKKGLVRTPALLCKIVCADAYTVALTNHDVDITYNDGAGALLYKSSLSGQESNIATDSTMSVDNAEINGALSIIDGEGFTAADIRSGRFDNAACYLYEVNYKDLTMGHEFIGPGYYRLGEFALDETVGSYRVELLSLVALLKQGVGERTSLTCRATFGDTRCKVVADWQTGVNGVVSSVGTPNTTKFTDSTLSLPDGHFVGVTLTFTASGVNNGLTRMVTDYTSGAFTLASALPEAITTADTWVPDNLNADMVVTGTITAVNATYPTFKFTDSSRAEAASFFVPGIITWVTGDNSGKEMEIKAFASGVFELVQPMAYNVTIGDTYSLRPDCPRTKAACVARNNLINMRAEPDMPVADAAQLMTAGAEIRGT